MQLINGLFSRPIKMACTICVLFIAIRCILLVIRLILTNLPAFSCSNSSVVTDNKTSVYDSWMVTVYYIILEVMRFAEYLVFGIHICKNWSSTRFSKLKKKRCLLLTLSVTPSVLAIFTVICQIMMEDVHEASYNGCSQYIYASNIYYAYCALNFLRYFLDFSIRLMMLMTTFHVMEIWNDSYVELRGNLENQSQVGKSVQQRAEEIHSRLSEKYDRAGDEVEKSFKPFRPWFIIPWIAYVYETSISVQNVLLPWEQRVGLFSLWAKLYTLSYSITQFYLLLIPYMCALKMNGCHQEYCRNTRKLQMEALKFNNITNQSKVWYQARARELHVDYQINYNFSPVVWGIHMNISMDTPLYIIVLLLNAFIVLSQSFFDSNGKNIYII